MGDNGQTVGVDPEATQHARSFVDSPDAEAAVLERFDRNGDRGLSLSEFRGFVDDPDVFGSEMDGPLRDFLDYVKAELKLDEQRRIFDGTSNTMMVAEMVPEPHALTYEGACKAIRQAVTDLTVAENICSLLDQAELAEIRGDIEARNSHILEGDQCLVFYLGGVPRPSHSGGLHALLADGSVHYARGILIGMGDGSVRFN